MHSISYERARDVAHAIELGSTPGSKFIGGGTNVLDLYKSGVERPTRAGTSKPHSAEKRAALSGVIGRPPGRAVA